MSLEHKVAIVTGGGEGVDVEVGGGLLALADRQVHADPDPVHHGGRAAAGRELGPHHAVALTVGGVAPDVVHTEGPGDAGRLLREARQAGVECIVLVGGDGADYLQGGDGSDLVIGGALLTTAAHTPNANTPGSYYDYATLASISALRASSAGASAVISCPLYRIRPADGFRNLVKRLKHVVLPAPFGPINA